MGGKFLKSFIIWIRYANINNEDGMNLFDCSDINNIYAEALMDENSNIIYYDRFAEVKLQEPSRKPTIAMVSALFSIVVVLLMTLGVNAQRLSAYPGILVTEFILVLIPSLALLFIFKYDLNSVLRFKGLKVANVFLAFGITVFAIPVAGIFNAANLLLVKYLFGRTISPELPIGGGAAGLLAGILVIGGSAAICEEIMFRGVIMRGLERFGVTKAILFSGFLFALIHLDLQKILGTFFLGALIGFMVYRTNSIFSGMIAHFTNNSIAVTLGFAANWLKKAVEQPGAKDMGGQGDLDKSLSILSGMPKAQLLIGIAFWVMVILGCIGVFIGLLVAFAKVNPINREEQSLERPAPTPLRGIVWLVPGFCIIAVRYVVEGLVLLGHGKNLPELVLRISGFK